MPDEAQHDNQQDLRLLPVKVACPDCGFSRVFKTGNAYENWLHPEGIVGRVPGWDELTETECKNPHGHMSMTVTRPYTGNGGEKGPETPLTGTEPTGGSSPAEKGELKDGATLDFDYGKEPRGTLPASWKAEFSPEATEQGMRLLPATSGEVADILEYFRKRDETKEDADPMAVLGKLAHAVESLAAAMRAPKRTVEVAASVRRNRDYQSMEFSLRELREVDACMTPAEVREYQREESAALARECEELCHAGLLEQFKADHIPSYPKR